MGYPYGPVPGPGGTWRQYLRGAAPYLVALLVIGALTVGIVTLIDGHP